MRPASKGEPTLLVLTVPAVASSVGDEVDVYALPLEFRQGGLLLALPHDSLSTQTLSDGQTGSDEHPFGPNSIFSAGLLEEADDVPTPVAVSLGIEAQVLVVDVHDDILSKCREYDPVTDSLATILGFSNEHPSSLPDVSVLLAHVSEWLLLRSDDRTGFYSAQEDQETSPPKAVTAPKKATAKKISNAMIADQLTAVVAQLQLITQRQDRLEQMASSSAADVPGQYVGPVSKLPAVSAGLPNPSGVSQTTGAKALSLIGPPPKTRNVVGTQNAAAVEGDEPYDALQPQEGTDGMLVALTNQSTALTALVAHLTAQSGDVLGDLTTPGQVGSSTKGVQRREKMQNDLACGNSQYFLQMMQQLHRRLHPAKPVPQTEENLKSLSVLQYLERQGGYKNNRELGLVAWVLGHAIDAASAGDFHMTKELLALLMVSVEQAVTDRGDWTLAFMLTLMEEPPIQVFQDRTASIAHHARPFGPLVPPPWTAVCLAYLKDMEVLSTKKGETAKRIAKAPSQTEGSPSAAAVEPDREASPKRKPRYPRKPKAKAAPEA